MSDISNLISNMQSQIANLTSFHLKNGNKAYLLNNEEKFKSVEKLISLLQYEISEIKIKISDNNNSINNTTIQNINNEINNLKNITNMNEMSMISNNNNQEINDELENIKASCNDNWTQLYNKIDSLNKLVRNNMNNNTNELYDQIQCEINYLKSRFKLINDKNLSQDIEILKNDQMILKDELDNIKFVTINNDYEKNKEQLRGDEITKLRQMIFDNDLIYKQINADFDDVKNKILANRIQCGESISNIVTILNKEDENLKKQIDDLIIENRIIKADIENLKNENTKSKQALKIIIGKIK